ncbi:MAG: SpoIID/LytB domain-containing protein, partial [Eubacteriales bacterium]|nr:SpoIID/LytB domain-containing protein [Eubacteriales bacterium]
ASGVLANRRILMEREGVSTYMQLEYYLPGVMVCQIDSGCEMEALKCQAVIARTYIYRLMDGRAEIREEELDLDYIGGESGAGSVKAAGMTIREKERLATELGRCRQAAEETAGQVMKYEDRYVLPLFHAVSAGRTRKGDEDYPYLQPVESRWDRERKDYRQSFSWSAAEFAGLVNQISGGTPADPEKIAGQLQAVKKDDSGYMLQVKAGASVFSGEQLQHALGLPSSCFSLEGADSRIQAVTLGRGHGYGLSQAGADAMAAEGWGFQDILHYYYKNISLVAE